MIVSKVIEKLSQAVAENPHTLHMDVEISGNLIRIEEANDLKASQSVVDMLC